MSLRPCPATLAPRRAARMLYPLLVVAGAALGAEPSGEGENFEFTGVVVDGEGHPIPELRVVLEAWRQSRGHRRLWRPPSARMRATTQTDSRGQYSISRTLRPTDNRFELIAGVPVRESEGERLQTLASVDVSQRVRQGSPVVATIVVPDRSFLDTLRKFVASVDSPHERQVYEEMGRPDRVQTIDFPTHQEVTWWYFRTGKAYRFREGALDQVVHFDPVEPFRP